MGDIQMTNVPDSWRPSGGSVALTKLVVPTSIDGLTNQENELLAELAEVWTRHASRNRKLTAYYESKEPLVDFGLTVPQSIKTTTRHWDGHARRWTCSPSFAYSRDSSRLVSMIRSNYRTS